MDLIEKFKYMPLEEFEELIFALQIDYEPPLQEEDRDEAIKELIWMIEHKDEITEDNVMKDRKEKRIREGKMCDQVNAFLINENLLLMSDQQLIYFPFTTGSGETRYYCFTRYEVENYILKEGINPYTGERFTEDELREIEDLLTMKKYPNIFVEGIITEIENRLSGKSLAYKVMEYRQLANEWANIVESVLKDFKTGIILDFATELSTQDYALFLTDSDLNNTIDTNISRNDAATQVMRIILDNYNTTKNINENRAKMLVTRVALAMDEFLYMIRNKLDYFQVLEDKGKMTANGVLELYWKPNNLVEDYYDNGAIAKRYFLDEDGNINGKAISYWKNGKEKIVKNFVHGRLDGLHKKYDDKGNPISKFNYVNGKKVGLQRTYNKGKLFLRYNLNENGEKEGLYEKFDLKGNKLAKYTYKNGELEGLQRAYKKNTLIREYYIGNYQQLVGIEKKYKNGVLVEEIDHDKLVNGLNEKYYPNGKLHERFFVKGGKIEGKHEVFDSKGKRKFIANYRNGALYGEQQRYKNDLLNQKYFINDEGNIDDWYIYYGKGGYERYLEKYDNGKKTGEFKEYRGNMLHVATKDEQNRIQGILKKYEGKDLVAIRNYVDDVLEGPQRNYYHGTNYTEDAYTMKENLFEGGWKHYDKYGNMEYIATYVNDEETDRQYYDPGELKDIETKREKYKVDEQNRRQGDTIINDSEGKLLAVYSYVDDVKEGLQTRYYESGKVKEEYNIINDKLDGFYKTYNEDGSIKSILVYIEGKEVSREH